MKKQLAAVMALVVALTAFAGVQAASAPASQTQTGGVTVSPAIEQLQLAAGQETADFKVKITNHKDVPIRVSLAFSDFKSLNESGGIAFLGQSASDLERSRGLSKWVRLEIEQVGLEPGQTAEINVHLEDLQSISPGGHYGAVIYQIIPGGVNPAGNRVNISQVLSSLVFAVTASGGTEHLSMSSPKVKKLAFSLPDKLNLSFTNDGNTQTAPRGSVAVYGSDPENPAATAVINSGSALVLPDSTRLLSTPLTTVSKPWWPGSYHIRVQYRADRAAGFSTYEAQFWYVNPVTTLLAAAIMAAILALIHKRHPGRMSQVARCLAHTLKVESILIWRDFKRLLRYLGKRLRRLAHTLKVESILVWRDFKLLLRTVSKRQTKPVKKSSPKRLKK